MRKKKAKDQAVENLINFLNQVKLFSDMRNSAKLHTISSIAKDFSVSSTAGAAIKQLKIIKQEDTYTWYWIAKEPSKEMALLVLDNLLHRNKKASDIAFPELEAISKQLSIISESMAQSTAQNNIVLNRIKSGNKSLDKSEKSFHNELDLFSEQQNKQRDRIYIAGQIASRLYPNGVENLYLNEIKLINSHIVSATDDLLKQLNN
jgi:hypothetical protein